MSAHTPGPWSVCDDPPNHYWLKGRTIVSAKPGDCRRVCDVFSFGEPEAGSRQEADARLIAAAPELLAALRAMTERYVSLVDWGDCGNWNPEGEHEVFMSRAAIAKATGATS